jgi:hypothetical protein
LHDLAQRARPGRSRNRQHGHHRDESLAPHAPALCKELAYSSASSLCRAPESRIISASASG